MEYGGVKMNLVKERLEHFINLRHRLVGTINEMVQLESNCYDETKQSIDYTCEIKEWMINPGRMLHGGIVATVIDMSMGGCAYVYSDAYYVPTISMNVQYLSAMHVGETMYIHARVLRIGKDVIQTSADITNVDGKICYHATASYALKRKDR